MGSKKKGFWKPAAAGFMVMYLTSMGLATGLVKGRFDREDELQFEAAASAILDQASEKEFSMEQEIFGEQDNVQGQNNVQAQEISGRQEAVWSREKRKDFYQNLANFSLWRIDSDYLQISIAAYDKDKTLLAKSRDEIGSNSVRSGSTSGRAVSFALDNYLAPEEKEVLAKYKAEDIQYCLQEPDVAERYRFSMRVSPDLKELWEIYVQEIAWEEDREEDGEGEEEAYMDPLTGNFHFMAGKVMIDYESGEEIGEVKNFHEVNGEVVWKWTNAKVEKDKLEEGQIVNTELSLLYLNLYGEGTLAPWQKWTKSSYLQGFSEKGEFAWEEGIEVPLLMVDEEGPYRRGRMQLQVGRAGDPFAYLEIRMESRPWYAALAYMKYVYLAGAVLTMLCMLAVIGMMHKVDHQQEALEETRKDLTNAIAHELKTPLGIIRNFAENLLEHHREEKRDYYLQQIIGQTEEMDRLVAEMIEVSKLDSEEFVLEREDVSFLALLREEMERFAPLIEEKKLKVEFVFQKNEDFLVQGDREYLVKAVWNLLANAVHYNVEGGRILIQVEKDQWMIENSGKPMGEEALIHAFDLFYTGDQSRRGKEKHMGLGLYLAKKILELHQLKLTLKNCSDGVQAVVRR